MVVYVTIHFSLITNLHTSMDKDLINVEMSGVDFNKIHSDNEEGLYRYAKQQKTKFYKFLNNDLTHYGFEYKLGLNVDTEPFKPKDSCSKGGLYFCEEFKCNLYYQNYGHKLARVSIPDDAKVYVERDKFKADKIILEDIVDFNDVPDEFWLNMFPRSDRIPDDTINALQFIKKQPEQLCIRVVQTDGMALRFVKNPSEDVYRAAAKKNGLAIKLIKNPSEDVCIYAVRQNGLAIKFIENPSENVCRNAISYDGRVIRYIKNPSNDMLILAIQQTAFALMYIHNQTEELCRIAVQKNGLVLQYVNHDFFTTEICRLAVQQNGFAIRFITSGTGLSASLVPNMSETLKSFVSLMPSSVLTPQFATGFMAGFAAGYVSGILIEDIGHLAVRQNGLALQYMSNVQTKELCVLAVKQNGLALQYVKEPFLLMSDICRLAVEQNDFALEFVPKSLLSDFYQGMPD